MVNPRKLISLCMIVRDEERQLPRCLKSVEGFVDEIIVVDTGSKDRTIEIAQQFGAIIVHAEWEHDFAKARNVGIAKAKGEWILFLDADEELDKEAGKQLLAEMDHAAAGLFLQIWNVVGASDDERGGTVHPVLRMFRSDPEIRFEGSIHEQIAASILRRWPQAVFQLTEAKIIHYGYRQDIVMEKNKLQRNMELLERAVIAEPNNCFHRYNIGVEFLRAGMPDKALEAFRFARQQAGFEQLSYAHLVVKYEVRSLLSLNRWAEAQEIAAKGMLQFADYPDMHHYFALSLAQNGKLEAAVRAAEKVLQLGESPRHYHTEDGIGTYRSSYMLGRLKETQLDTNGVIQAYITSLRFHSSLTPPLYRLCRYLRIVGEKERLASLLSAKLTCRSEEAIVKVANVMVASDCEQAAKEWVRWHIAQLGSAKIKGLELWLEQADRAESEVASGEEDEQAKAAALVSVMCKQADHYLEQRQLMLKGDGCLMGKRPAFAEKMGEQEKCVLVPSNRAIAAIRLLIPCEEGWVSQR